MSITHSPDGNGDVLNLPTGNHALDNESKVAEILAVTVIFGTLSTIAVILRIYTRAKILKFFRRDDILIVIAQLLIITYVIVIGLAIKYGLGTHIWTLSSDNIATTLKSIYIAMLVYFAALNIIKLSILFQIRNIFIGKKFHLITLIAIILTIIWNFTGLLVGVLICRPLSGLWDLRIPAVCLNIDIIYVAIALVNILADFAIFTIPLVVIKTLNLPKRQKIFIVIIFSLGFFTCCVSILRLRALIVDTGETGDLTWDYVSMMNWTIIELTTAVVAACLPSLRPLMTKIIPSFFTTTNDTDANQILDQSQSKSVGLSEIVTRSIKYDPIISVMEKKIQIPEV